MASEYCIAHAGETTQSFDTLQWPDYLVLGMSLAVSMSIGIFFGYVDRNKTSTEILMGGGNVSPIPIAMSLATTFFSALTIMSTPVEYYHYGSMYTYFLLAYVFCLVLSVEVFAPMYKTFGLTTLYEYLEIRFHWSVRYMATIEYFVHAITYVGIIIYLPAVALETVTGLDKWVSVWLTGGICIFYTSIGGLKAVVWTDSFQIFVMLSGFIAITIKGSVDNGGFGPLLENYQNGNRNVWNEFDWDPRFRHTFWTIMIGNVVGGSIHGYCTSQSFVQRTLACKTQKEMRIATYGAWFGIAIINILAGLTGIVLYTYNECCDPYKAGWIPSTDQMVPYMTVQMFANTPGVAGLYVSAAFSGSLSSVSSGINSMTTVMITDFLRRNEKRIWKSPPSEKFYAILSKVFCVIFGLLCIAFTYVAANFDSILQAALSIAGLLGSPIFAVFCLGFFNPWAEPIGVWVGYVLGNAVAIWCYVGSNIYPPLPEYTKKLYTEVVGCEGEFSCEGENATNPWCPQELSDERPAIAEFYSISYLYLGTLGLLTTFIVGSATSAVVYCVKRHSPKDLPEKVLFPPLDRCFPRYICQLDDKHNSDSQKSSL